jgi:hypothetical protein
VTGNLNQSVTVVKPPGRNLSDAQRNSIINALKPFAQQTTHLKLFCTTTDTESANFSKQLLDVIEASGIKPEQVIWGQAFGNGPLLGVEIAVRDGHSPPALAEPLGNALIRAGVVVKGAQCPDWPESSKDDVRLSIFLNPNTQ